MWAIEDYQGSKRLRNVASGNYLSIENLKDQVEVLAVRSDWMSPRWAFEGDPAAGPIILRNGWHNWQVLLVEDSTVTYAEVPTEDDKARWYIELSEGSVLTEATPMPLLTIAESTNPPGSRGAQVPWQEYEAELGATNGTILEPDRTFGTFASESSGRSAVQLDGPGAFVEVVSLEPANSIVVRTIIPDSEDGSGLESTLSLYIDGKFRQKINLTSKYAWSYGGEERTFNIPEAGGAHHFYDESRALVGDIPAGATVRLQVDDDDDAEYYVIDLIDLELVDTTLDDARGLHFDRRLWRYSG